MLPLPPAIRRSFLGSVAVSFAYILLYLVVLHRFGNEQELITQLRGNLFSVVGDALALFWCLSGMTKKSNSGTFSFPRQWSVFPIAIASISLGVADSIWAYLEWHGQSPFPSIADVFYLFLIPCLLCAVLLFPTKPLSKIALMRVMLDGMLILTALIAFSWHFVLGPTILGKQNAPQFERTLSIFYPAGDLLLAACFLVLFLRAGHRAVTPATICFSTGILILTVGDTLFLYRSLHGSIAGGTSLDLTWPGGMVFCGLAARYLNLTASIRAEMPEEPPSEPGNTDQWLSLIRACLPYLMVPCVGVLFFSTVMHSHQPTLLETGVYVSTSLLVVLIVVRQFVFLVENFQLYRQTRRDADNLKQLNAKLQETQAELLHAAKMASLGTLSAGVAHELNQPVAIARGITQQLLSERDLPTYAREDLTLIEAQTGRMMHIIHNLRTFCRTTGFDVESTSLNEIVQVNLSLISTQLKSHGITLRVQLSEDEPSVYVNSNEIAQVFLNILTNARDALENRENPVLTIRSGVQGDKAYVEFADNGQGIPLETRERIFDPFFTTKEVGKGTGLGLSISQNLVQKNGGTLTVHNDNGAVFTVWLPRVVEPEIYPAELERATVALTRSN